MFRQMWFLFDIIVKCQAQWLIQNRLLKAPRRDRFPVDVIARVEELIQFISQQIVLRHKEVPGEVKSANNALAVLIRVLYGLQFYYLLKYKAV